MPRIARATRELQWLGQWVPTLKRGGNPETRPQLGSRAVTRPREHGIPSNRASSARGEYVPAPCTHRPSFHSSGFRMRRGPLWLCRILGSREGKSRNKVAVGEPAAGSPPKKQKPLVSAEVWEGLCQAHHNIWFLLVRLFVNLVVFSCYFVFFLVFYCFLLFFGCCVVGREVAGYHWCW
jgi:hypothetical protein